MSQNDNHYRKMLGEGGKSALASCGYVDRFDPFRLNKVPFIRELYGNLFARFIGDKPCVRLLDVGCGTGIYFDVLSQYADEVDAIDCSEEMVSVAQKYCMESGLSQIRPTVGTIEALNHADETFDVVIELDVLHHVEDFDKAIAEVHRVLKPGGRFFVFEPNILNPLMFLAHAIPSEERLALRRNTPARLKSLLEQRFRTQQWDGVCALVTQTEGVKRMILDAYIKAFSLSGLVGWYPRQAWLGIKH